MVFEKKETAKYLTIGLIAIIGILVFFLLKPVITSIFAGLVLAYLLMPLYKKFLKVFKNRSLAAWVVLILLLIVIAVPLWFIIPISINQIFEAFRYTQTLNIDGFIKAIFPTASDAFSVQATVTIETLISKATAGLLTLLTSTFMEIPSIFLHVFIVGFVFFFGLRDSDKLMILAQELSPFSKSKEKLMIQQFKSVTDSIVYGHIAIGILQGLLAGLGFLIFGIHNVLVLTFLTIFMSVIPLGPYIIYIPLALILFATGPPGIAIAFLAYNFIIVSTLDNFLRTYIVAKRSSISTPVVFVGMMGGLFMFGIIGMLIGPLILAYFLVILQLYKEKELSGLFLGEDYSPVQETAEKK